MRTKLVFSFTRRKKGLFADSYAITALEEGTKYAIWDWVLFVESKAMKEKEKLKKL